MNRDSDNIRRQQDHLKHLKNQLVLQTLLGIPLLVLTAWRMPASPEPDIRIILFIQFFLTTLMILVARSFYYSGVKALIRRQPTMESLIALGTGAAYVVSLLSGTSYFSQGRIPGFGEFYFESVGIILLFSTLGKYIEFRAGEKTLSLITDFIKFSPTRGIVFRGGRWKELPIEDILPGDRLRVDPGCKVPVDGVVLEGESHIDESVLVGESRPVRKCGGDNVSAATVNGDGVLVIKALKVGADTLFAKTIQQMEESPGLKAPICEPVDKITARFVPFVLSLAIISAGFWYIKESIGPAGSGNPPAFAMNIFISVLIISCPCMLGLAVPMAVAIGSGLGTRLGIRVRSTEALQRLGKVDTIVFDKTGTLTCGKPVVSDVLPGRDEALFLEVLHTLEGRSKHQLASAVMEFTLKKGVPELPLTEFHNEPGLGISGTIEGVPAMAGSLKYLRKENVSRVDEIVTLDTQLKQQGKTVIHVSWNLEWQGLVALSDDIRRDAEPVIFDLHRQGIELWMITGDNRKSAELAGQLLGIPNILAEVLPGEKAEKIQALRGQGKIVGMIGDGINDARALALADVGISIRSGPDIPTDTSDLVLTHPNLKGILKAILLSQRVIRKINQNLFWTFFYNISGIPVAMGVLYPFTGHLLNPLIVGLAIVFSSVSVVNNTLQLKKDKKLSRLLN